MQQKTTKFPGKEALEAQVKLCFRGFLVYLELFRVHWDIKNFKRMSMLLQMYKEPLTGLDKGGSKRLY